MGYCNSCGEVVRTHNGVCPCGGKSKDSESSGFTSNDNKGDKISNAYLSSGLNAGVEKGLKKAMGMESAPVNENCIECSRKLTTSEQVFVGPTHAGGHPYCEPCYSKNFKKGDCQTCRKPVLGLGREYVVQEGMYWHKECFKNGKSCATCSQVIFGEAVEALNAHYHPQCFKCVNCHENLTGGFMDLNSHPCCKACFTTIKASRSQPPQPTPSQTIPSAKSSNSYLNSSQTYGNRMDGPESDRKCSKCSKIILGTAVQLSNDQVLHPECFTCGSCSKPINGKHILENGTPHHPECRMSFVKANPNFVCGKCSKPITAKFIKIDESTVYHSECFTCVVCHKSLGGQAFGDTPKGPTCEPCLQKDVSAQPKFVPGFTVNQAGLKELRGPGGFKLVENEALRSLGGTSTCPKCNKSVFPMEKVIGPMNTSWHKYSDLMIERVLNVLGVPVL